MYSAHLDAIIIYSPNPLEGRLTFVISEGLTLSVTSLFVDDEFVLLSE